MDLVYKTTDYLMDFNKVRKFQNLCGLKEVDDMSQVDSESDADSDYSEREYQEMQKSTLDKKSDLKYRVGKPFLHKLFLLGSVLGTEIFYITFIPFVMWNLDEYIARKTITIWVVTMYIGQAAKDILKWPRPTSPPAFKLEKRVAAEYGLPSTHAIAGTSIPFAMFLTSIGRFEYPLILGFGLAVCWSLLVSLSRLYVGMHSIMDVLGGVSISFVYLFVGQPFMDVVDDYTLNSPFAPYIIIVSHYLLALFYPNTERGSTTRADTAVIVGVGAGVLSGFWFNQQYGLPIIEVDHLPISVSVPSIMTILICIARFIVGAVVVFPSKTIIKILAKSLVSQIIVKEEIDEDRKVVPVKFITYSCVGICIVVICPLIMRLLGLSF